MKVLLPLVSSTFSFSVVVCAAVQPCFPRYSLSSFSLPEEFICLNPFILGTLRRFSFESQLQSCGSLWSSSVCQVGQSSSLCLPYAFSLRVVYLRSLVFIIIVHIFSFHADQWKAAGSGSKSSFNFYDDGLSLHLKWCLICTRALRLLNIELIWLLLEINSDFTIYSASWTYEAP